MLFAFSVLALYSEVAYEFPFVNPLTTLAFLGRGIIVKPLILASLISYQFSHHGSSTLQPS
jgi:hypothetical protein